MSHPQPTSMDAAGRVAFLAEAGAALAASLDYEHTLRQVARLAVPVLGDFCILDVVEGDRVRRLAAHHAVPAKAALLEELRDRYPPDFQSPQPAGRVLRSGEPELLADVSPDVVVSHSRDPDHARLIRGIGIRSHLAVPLVARDHTVGVISLGVTESDRRYDRADLALAQELARRAAMAVDNARLYRAAQDELAERRRVEAALRDSEDRFRQLADHLPAGFIYQIVQSPDGELRFSYASGGVRELFGLDPAAVAADPATMYGRILPEDLPRMRAQEMEAFTARTPFDSQFRVRGRDGSVRWLHARSAPRFLPDGGSIWDGIAVDITDRVRADEEVRLSEGRFRGIMEQSPLSTQLLTADGYTIRVNRAWEELWGLTLDQLADYNMLRDPQLEARGVMPYIRRAFAGEAVEIPAIRYDPEETLPNRTRHRDPARWVRAFAYPVKDEAGAVREVVLIHEDITARVRAEAEVRETADRLRLAMSAAALGDWQWDTATDLVTMSPRAADVFGIPPGPVMTWAAMRDLLHPDDRHRARVAVEEAVAARGQYDVEYRVRRPDGAQVWVASLGRAQYDDGGAVLGMYGIIRDVTERKRLEEELRRRADELAAADRKKDEFLATLAHELRNPLAPIRSSLEVIRLAGGRPGLVAPARETAERQVHHLTRLVDDLLDVSRIMRGKVELRPERVELSAVIDRAVETARSAIDAAGHRFEVVLPNHPVTLDADPVRLAQVLGNLLLNAARYTEPGGTIRLTGTADRGAVTVSIRDTGIGIAPDMLTKVFEPFTQLAPPGSRSPGGLGVGLALVKKFVELHGGTAEAHSDGLGRGSEFTVRLPTGVDVGRGDVGPVVPSSPRPGPSSLRVLVVDDHPDAAESLAMLLEVQGHAVRLAHDGQAALAAVRAERPDLVLLDIGMPGMDGYEVARRLRADPTLNGLVLAALTGWGQDRDRDRAREAGFDVHFTKPVEPGELERLLSSLRAG